MDPLLAALVAAGLITPEDAAIINRQLDPVAAREYAETQLLQAFQVGLSGQRDRLIDAVRSREGLLSATQQNRLWAGENDLLWQSVRGTILDLASERATVAAIQTGGIDVWKLVNDAVIEWADGYYISEAADHVGSIPNINQTSRTHFARAFVDWQRGELETAGFADGLPQLIRSIEPIFGVVRAEAIGVTETTRIFSQSELVAGDANPFVEAWVYNTAMDDRVSEYCINANGAVMLKGETVFSDGDGPPPRHVRCRSGITAVTLPALEALRAQGLAHA